MQFNFLPNIITQLTPGRKFTVVILLILVIVGLYIYRTERMAGASQAISLETIKVQQEILTTLTKININLEIAQNGYSNLLDADVATDYMESILGSSYGKINEEVIRIVVNNHIDNPSRKIIIKKRLQKKIQNFYESDLNKLSKVYYNGQTLDKVWDSINPQIVIDNIQSILFSAEYRNDLNHGRLNTDIMARLKLDFETYNEQTKKLIKQL